MSPSNSPWASPVVPVAKKCGVTRFCADFRKLNAVTKKDVYPIPRLDDALDRLANCKYFTSLDMASGYWQIPVAPPDREKTAFVTPDGLFEFNYMPFGLCNAGATFQRTMDRILAEFRWQFCIVYIDDVLIYSRSFSEHLQHIDAVFKCFKEAGVVIKPSKCVFASSEITYLGHIINEHGTRPDPSKVEAVKHFPLLSTVTEVKSFLGLCSYFRRYVQNFAQLSEPLVGLTRKSVPFVWTAAQQKAFETLKERLISAPILAHYDAEAELQLHTDASIKGIGACLIICKQNREQVLAYASRLLNSAEARYSTTEQECLAVVWSIKKFRPYLFGKKFTVVTDHCALCWLMSRKEPAGRLSRWSIALQQYDFEVKYRSGKRHQNADALSRFPVGEAAKEEDDDLIPTFLTMPVNLSSKQDSDPVLRNIRLELGSAGSRAGFHLMYTLKEGILYRKIWREGETKLLMVLPKQLRQQVLYACHDERSSGHLGFWRTWQRVRQRFYWPRMLADVRKYVNSCVACQMRKTPTGRPGGNIEAIPVGEAFEMCGIDIFGPLPRTKKGNQYIIVCTDYLTKWVETKAVPAQTAVAVANFLVTQVILRHGAPARLVSDQGGPFMAAVTEEILKICQTRHVNTTAYNPACNGLTEVFNKVLATMLSIYTNEKQNNWDESLSFITSAYNTSKQASTNFTPFFLLFGRECRSPLDVQLRALPSADLSSLTNYAQEFVARMQEAKDIARENILKTQTGYVLRGNEHRQSREYKMGDLVLLYIPVTPVGLSPKLVSHFFGPYRVINRVSRLNYQIEAVRSKTKGKNILTVHVKRLKLFNQRLSPEDEDIGSEGRWDVAIEDVDPELREDIENAEVVPKHSKPDSELGDDSEGPIVRKLRNRTVRGYTD